MKIIHADRSQIAAANDDVQVRNWRFSLDMIYENGPDDPILALRKQLCLQ